jgi:hypothetical protein
MATPAPTLMGLAQLSSRKIGTSSKITSYTASITSILLLLTFGPLINPTLSSSQRKRAPIARTLFALSPSRTVISKSTLRLRVLIPFLVHPDQTGFISGRSITENFVYGSAVIAEPLLLLFSSCLFELDVLFPSRCPL